MKTEAVNYRYLYNGIGSSVETIKPKVPIKTFSDLNMNYFELFDIPVQLKVDSKALSSRFFELSRKYHPDYAATGSEEAQAEALDMSSLLNKAWRTFQRPDETVRYVLLEKGLLEEEEKYQLAPEFLMEVMDINEQVMDLEENEPGKKTELANSIDQLSTEIYEPVKDIVEHYQEGISTEAQLLQVKAWYYKKKYLDRIGKELKEK